VAAVDLNGDHKPDLVTTDAGDGVVNVLLNNGDGTFTYPTSFYAASSPVAVAAADLNGDGKVDLVTASGDSWVSVLPGDGQGAFGNPYTFTVGTSSASVATGDFNGGLTDLAVADSASNNVAVLLNTGFWPTLQVAATDPGTGAALTSTTANTPFNLTVTARDPAGNVLTNYTDTVSFNSYWDTQATIIDPVTGNPVSLQNFTYTFTAADHGTHTFSVDLKTAGTQVITVSDPTAGTSVITAYIYVNPAAASTFQVGGFQSPISAGDSSYFSVTAYDPYGNVATNYAGTVVLSSSDPSAAFGDWYSGNPLSANSYTFVPGSDYGTHYFYATLNTVGTQSISATDSVKSAISGSQTGIQVVPIATIAGPTAGYINQTLTFTLGTIGEPAGTIFTYKIDWNGDGIVDQTVKGPSGTTVTHTFTATSNVQVTATDPNGLTTAPVYQYVYAAPISVAIQTDPAVTSQQMLVITGSPYSDTIVLGTGANNNGVTLNVNGYALGTIVPTQGTQFALVIVLGQGGYDTLDARNLSVSSVLVGGADGDYLYGGSGRNLLIGGLGSDVLYAGSAGDIVIGGYTKYDSNTTALAYIMAEWDRTDVSYSTRVKHLSGSLRGSLSSSYFLKSTTVLDDSNTRDVLNGGAGVDWYFVHKKGKRQDQVIGQTSGEVVTSI
jgi:hypothetical protein